MWKEKIFRVFRRYFVTGMIVIIPLWITVLIVRVVVKWIDGTFDLLPDSIHPQTYIPFRGVDYVIALVLIILVGALASNYFGRKLFNLGERFLAKIPVIKTIYQGIKHLTIGVVGEKKIFQRAVLLEFPIKGLFFIGFVTGEVTSVIQSTETKKLLKIFVPTTPNPTSGFFCIAAEDEVKPLEISVDEAFKLIISAGYADLKID